MGAVYLAGKMSGLTFKKMSMWRIRAAKVLKKANFKVFDPVHTDLASAYSSKSIVVNNKYQIRHSDIVLAEFDYEDISLGTFGEIVFAYENNIPVITWGTCKKIYHPWIQFHITNHFIDLEDALNHIIENYYC